jgi:hypothetical protein
MLTDIWNWVHMEEFWRIFLNIYLSSWTKHLQDIFSDFCEINGWLLQKNYSARRISVDRIEPRVDIWQALL